ncbi:hypothetical protein [Brevibacillus sp. SYSU BS000544]|uniref:hypothetical protein n=1 Tax=Brevibacillus sp. SYSU BS000544 TaxID=3416443 RepID=UPI003CE50B76
MGKRFFRWKLMHLSTGFVDNSSDADKIRVVDTVDSVEKNLQTCTTYSILVRIT